MKAAFRRSTRPPCRKWPECWNRKASIPWRLCENGVAQALLPAVSRFLSTLFAGITRCRIKSVPMSGDAAGRSACATALIRQREQVRRQILQVLRRQFVGRHDRPRHHLPRIGKVVLYPTAALTFGESVKRRTDLHAPSVDQMAGPAAVRLVKQRTLRGKIRRIVESGGVLLVEFQQKRRQRIQLRIGQLDGWHRSPRTHRRRAFEMLDHPCLLYTSPSPRD